MLPNLRNILLAMAGTAGVAWATTTGESTPTTGPAAQKAPAAAPIGPRRFHCQVFATPLDSPLDTRDRSSAVGRWITDYEGRGWEVATIDFEVGQKPTGFAEGYVQVCLTPVLRAPNPLSPNP